MRRPRITWEQYLGNLKVGAELGDNYAEHLARNIRRDGELVRDEWREYEASGHRYRIGMGRYSSKPESNAGMIRQWGLLHLACSPADAADAPTIHGMINQRCLWIHPEHRGRGLGPEMCFDRAVARIKRLPLDTGFPCLVDWEDRTQAQKHPPAIAFTLQGVECLKRTYILLVERSMIDPLGCAMPELGDYDG